MLSIYLENKKVVSNRSVLGLGRKVRPGTSQNHDPIHGCCGPVTHHVVDAYGAEAMKPLATPVLGGMVSSLLHVSIVTPVIFTWLRERELSRKETAPAA